MTTPRVDKDYWATAFSWIVKGNENGIADSKNNLAGSDTVLHRLTIWSSNATPEYLP